MTPGWSFDGALFAVASDGAMMPEWFTAKIETSVDVVAGSASKVYVDIGGVSREPLSLMAQFTATASRDTLEAKLGTTGTLSDDDGRSCQAILVAASPVRVVKRGSGFYRLAVQFVWVGAS
jgi:hypothetical protein